MASMSVVHARVVFLINWYNNAALAAFQQDSSHNMFLQQPSYRSCNSKMAPLEN